MQQNENKERKKKKERNDASVRVVQIKERQEQRKTNKGEPENTLFTIGLQNRETRNNCFAQRLADEKTRTTGSEDGWGRREREQRKQTNTLEVARGESEKDGREPGELIAMRPSIKHQFMHG